MLSHNHYQSLKNRRKDKVAQSTGHNPNTAMSTRPKYSNLNTWIRSLMKTITSAAVFLLVTYYALSTLLNSLYVFSYLVLKKM